MGLGARLLYRPAQAYHVSGRTDGHAKEKAEADAFGHHCVLHMPLELPQPLPASFVGLASRDFADHRGTFTELDDPNSLPRLLLRESARRRDYLYVRPDTGHTIVAHSRSPIWIAILTFSPWATLHVSNLLQSGADPGAVSDQVVEIAKTGHRHLTRATRHQGIGFSVHTDTHSLHVESALSRYFPADFGAHFPSAADRLGFVGPQAVGVQRQLDVKAVPTPRSREFLEASLARFHDRFGPDSEPNDIKSMRAIDAACERVFGPDLDAAKEAYRKWHANHVIEFTTRTYAHQKQRADELETRVNALETENGQLSATISTRSAHASELETRLHESTATTEALQKKVSTLEETRQAAESDNARLRTENAQLRGEFELMQRRLQALESPPRVVPAETDENCSFGISTDRSKAGMDSLLNRIARGQITGPTLEKDNPNLG